MTSRERVLCALQRGTPDRVPYCEVGVSNRVMLGLWGDAPNEGIIGGIDEMDQRGPEQEAAISQTLGRDHICFRVHPPVPVERQVGADGVSFYGEGLVKSRRDLSRVALPDPEGEAVWGGVEAFMAQAGDYATCLATRVGVSPVYLAMGTEAFAVALYGDPGLVEAVLELYTGWAEKVVRKGMALGFDFIWTADDLAYRTGPLMSPRMFRDLFLPRMRKVADSISIPWVFHSDGNLAELMPDLLDLGISGINPVEPEAMDIVAAKRRWGDQICLLGNVSVHLLSAGSPGEVRAEVRRLLREVAPGGGYILTSGNSLASYCRPENVRAMVETLQEYGAYPL